ncbi:per os infectivity factor 1 [Orgyia leucostigma nucleopolyhedrovirus]|uniref:Per os infectivity factor 1 n=1 Tax=Orgyia leucostigma nucleopolyhedrovirus TaxID=490711 RepID=B0FDZ4_9ABAC|nr:per os infectivity factor 1 [Orgyia leucostigma nucleopolyhedrovirus]ABY65852.1 per os infectivity factor 1 [Orgyia leucostigma nucleopolyhedrovirus]
MYLVVLSIILILIIVSLCSINRVLYAIADEIVVAPLPRFDNSNVPLIEPPSEIYIEGNTRECHKNLTPCTTHADCDACREGLANCQHFTETTMIVIHDDNGAEIRHTIQPGESYCMALDRERARSCNPHTGLWLLAESAVGFSLLCSCLTPGLVTQLNMYEDCNVTVGCQPHGRIANINETPLRCECDEGYIADFDNATQTPHCRPLTVRDVVYDEIFFPRAPCQDGFVRLDHPSLDPIYRQELRLPDICVVDPCSVDPISNQRTAGRLAYYRSADGTVEYKYCRCPLWNNLFSVYSPTPSMIGESSAPVANACIRPFAFNLQSISRIDYKFFWARSDKTRSDDDIVCMVRSPSELSHERYARLLYTYLTRHPDTTILSGSRLLKFSTAYSVLDDDNNNAVNGNAYEQYVRLAARTSAPCFFPGVGRCITVNRDDCIRRHAAAQVWTAETFTNSWCVFSREGSDLRIWSPATRYPNDLFPVVLRVNLLFGIINHDRNYTTVSLVAGDDVTTGANVDNLATLLNTYADYSIN